MLRGEERPGPSAILGVLSFEEGGVLSEFRRWFDWPSGSVDEPSSRGTESSALCCAVRLGVESARRGLTRIWRILENCYHPESYMDVQDLVDGRKDGREDGSNGGPAHPLDP
nr:uncharacterized protein LOC116151404 isoform X6 [Camelus dromedarius]